MTDIESPWTDEDRAVIRAELIANGASEPERGIHEWRCQHPDRYGPCSCVDETTDDIANALANALAPRVAALVRAGQADLHDVLVERLEQAEADITALARRVYLHEPDYARLAGKRDGVALALSYVREIERGE